MFLSTLKISPVRLTENTQQERSQALQKRGNELSIHSFLFFLPSSKFSSFREEKMFLDTSLLNLIRFYCLYLNEKPKGSMRRGNVDILFSNIMDPTIGTSVDSAFELVWKMLDSRRGKVTQRGSSGRLRSGEILALMVHPVLGNQPC